MQIHKSVILVIAIGGTFSAPLVSFGQSPSSANSEITVRISVDRKAVTAGQPVHLEVRVSNTGKEPTLVANRISTISGGIASLTIELKDAQGRALHGTSTIADNFRSPPLSDEHVASKLLGNWALLGPRTSLLFEVLLDDSLFSSLRKPGQYKISATYAASCKSFAHDHLGVRESVFDELPYPCWSGRLRTNEISVTVLSRDASK